MNFEYPKEADWKRPILGDIQVPCYKFGCRPVLEVGTDIPIGTQVELGCDILWLIIGQSIFTSEWKKNRAVMHIRNMTTASLNLLSVWICTSVEKSILPPTNNKNQIVLASVNPNPRLKNIPACISFDPRLHIDSFNKNHSRVHLVLSQNTRKKSDFKMIEMRNMPRIMYYDRIIQSRDDSWEPTLIQHLLNGPPESWAHAQPYLRLQQIAMNRFVIESMEDTKIACVYWEKMEFEFISKTQKPIGNSELQDFLRDLKSPCYIPEFESENIDLSGLSKDLSTLYEVVEDFFWRPVIPDTRFEAIS